MAKPRHQAFLDLEESLAARLRNAWSRYWTPLSNQMVILCSDGRFDEAHALAESIDLAPLYARARPFARTVGMSALLLGASRLRSIRGSRIEKHPPIKELDAFLRQTETMLARNATQALRQQAHEWVNQEEAKLLKAEWREEDHPRGKTTPESTPGSFRPIQYWANKQAADAFDGFVKAPRTEGITAAEEAWQGGVADFGDPEAAYLIQDMPGYFDYRSHLEEVARKTLGGSFTVYRLMTPAQLEEWQQTGDVGPVSVTFNRHFADRFRNFAGFKPGIEFVLVETQASPESIVMMGKEEEQEIVIDSTYVSGHTLKIIPSNFVKSEIAKRERYDQQVRISVAGKNYFGLASSIQVSRMSAFGFLLEAAEAGQTNYRVDAVLDEKTCEVCRHMDGWVFPVEAGLQLAQQIMDTDDPEALKALAPFYAQNKASIAALSGYATEDFVNEGMSLPPYHPLCRCILTPTDEEADLHPTQIADRVALASQTLYGEGDGVRLTQDLFGIEHPTEETRRHIGDLIPGVLPAEEEMATWLEHLITESEPAVPLTERTADQAAEWIEDLVVDWLSQPAAAVPPPALVTPVPFEGTTIPANWVEPFDPGALRRVAEMRWPWLAGLLGWLALDQQKPLFPEGEEALIEEEELADEERDERDELREDRRNDVLLPPNPNGQRLGQRDQRRVGRSRPSAR